MSDKDYENDVLVSADWVEDHLEEFQADDPEYRLLEVNNPSVSDESEYTPYDSGHIPGATFFDWDKDLSDDVERDILSKEDFEALNSAAGISDSSTVVLYGDGHVPNWFALFAYWEYKYFGHDDVRILDGGKPYWVENDYELTTDVNDFTEQEYTAKGPFEGIRSYGTEVEQATNSGIPLVDVRSPEEFSGEILAPEGLGETCQVGGHIPGAKNIPTASVLADDGRFLPKEELRGLYEEAGVTDDQAVIAYCRVGERSSIAWFVLHELLDYPDVSNYDGSWTEWGNRIRAPVETGPAE